MVVKDEAKDFEPIPDGLQQAVLVANHNLGTRPGYAGKDQHKVVLVWEMAERRTEGDFAGQRFVVTKQYTATMNERGSLSKDLESWRGIAFTEEERRGFELNDINGQNCNLNLVPKIKDGRTYVNIASITKLHKGQKKIEPEHLGFMPKWVANIVNQNGDGEVPTGDDFEDDIPF